MKFARLIAALSAAIVLFPGQIHAAGGNDAVKQTAQVQSGAQSRDASQEAKQEVKKEALGGSFDFRNLGNYHTATTAETPNTGFGSMMVKMVASLSLILGLIFAAAWALNKLASSKNPKLAGLFGGRNLVKVLGTGHIGVKKSIIIADVAGELLVLGVSNNGISMLTKLDRRDFDSYTGGAPTAAGMTGASGGEGLKGVLGSILNKSAVQPSRPVAKESTAKQTEPARAQAQSGQNIQSMAAERFNNILGLIAAKRSAGQADSIMAAQTGAQSPANATREPLINTVKHVEQSARLENRAETVEDEVKIGSARPAARTPAPAKKAAASPQAALDSIRKRAESAQDRLGFVV